MKIFIVEDELMAIAYLKTLLRECGEEYTVVGEATNGAKALPEIERLRPDVVFADICMPVMDGLEMSERIMRLKNPPVVFILSSYRDFDYAKRGIRAGVRDYILKNDLSAESLGDLLEKTKAQIDNGNRDRHIILEHNVREFLVNAGDDNPDESMIYSEKPLQRYVIVHALCPSPFTLKEEVEPPKINVDCYEINRLPMPEGLSCPVFLEVERSKFVSIIFIHPNCRNEWIQLEKYAQSLREAMSKYNPGVRIVMSEVVPRFSELQKLYNTSREMLYHLYCRSDKMIFREEELRSTISDTDASVILSEFKNIVEKKDVSAGSEDLKECVRRLRGISFKTYLSAAEAMHSILTEYIQSRKLDEGILEMPEYFEDLNSLESEMIALIDRLSAYLQKVSEENYSSYVLSAMDYIHKNYMNDISIADIAEAVNLSEGHLRRLFKQETGEKIVGILTDCRIEHAKKMMKGGNMNLEEIWRSTGFSSAQYFSYVFKQKEGASPRDFSRKLQAGNSDV